MYLTNGSDLELFLPAVSLKKKTLFMFLRLVAVDQLGQVRDFTCQMNKLEVVFDVLNQIVAQGHALMKASIVDENKATSLPLEVFQGVSFLKAMQELEQEWQSILTAPADSQPSFHQERIQRLQQQVQRYEQQLARIETMIIRLSGLRQRADDLVRFLDKGAVGNHFASLLEKKQTQRLQVRLLQQCAYDTLSELQERN